MHRELLMIDDWNVQCARQELCHGIRPNIDRVVEWVKLEIKLFNLNGKNEQVQQLVGLQLFFMTQ